MLLLLCSLLSLVDISAARRHRLRQDDSVEDTGDEYDTFTEMYFDYANAFLAGFKS